MVSNVNRTDQTSLEKFIKLYGSQCLTIALFFLLKLMAAAYVTTMHNDETGIQNGFEATCITCIANALVCVPLVTYLSKEGEQNLRNLLEYELLDFVITLHSHPYDQLQKAILEMFLVLAIQLNFFLEHFRVRQSAKNE